ncbi:MAG TPA: L-rhamnose mutarotase [Bacilli bacterium]
MEIASFVLNIREADQAEYIKRHEAVYPELLQAFREAGVKKYSIFMHGGTLFAYMEAENFNEAMAYIGRQEANTRWQAFMSDLLVMHESGSAIKIIPEVFHFEA